MTFTNNVLTTCEEVKKKADKNRVARGDLKTPLHRLNCGLNKSGGIYCRIKNIIPTKAFYSFMSVYAKPCELLHSYTFTGKCSRTEYKVKIAYRLRIY